MKYCTLFYFRMTFRRLKYEVVNIMYDARRLEACEEDVILMPLSSNSDKVKNKVKDSEQWYMRRGADIEELETFMTRMSPESLNVPEGKSRSSVFTNGVPILDFTRAYAEKVDAWNYPSPKVLDVMSARRVLTWGMQDGVEVAEVFMGTSSQEEVMEFSAWLKEKFEEDQSVYPTGTLACSIMEMMVTEKDVMRMGDFAYRGHLLKLSKKLNNINKLDSIVIRRMGDSYRGIPVKIFVGNGHSWLRCISMPMARWANKDFWNVTFMQQEMMELLRDLPPLLGVELGAPVELLRDFLATVAGVRLPALKIVELEAVALLAGWQERDRSLQSISLGMLGTRMNAHEGSEYTMWGSPFNNLPKALQVVAVGEVMTIYSSHMVLVSCMVIDLFSDPDVICYLGECGQMEFLKWLLPFITEAVRDTEVYIAEDSVRRMRDDLARGIREVFKGEIRGITTVGVEVLMELRHDFPVITVLARS